MSNHINFTIRAKKAFLNGDYGMALYYYQKASSLLGKEIYQANIQISKNRLQELRKADYDTFPAVKTAAIMDAVTEANFSSECMLASLHPDSWHEQLAEFQPDIVFIEAVSQNSIWHDLLISPNAVLSRLTEWARKSGVPVIFWNNKDPNYFESFLHIAKLADYIFTTDYDLVSRYKAELGHDRVYLLPYGVQQKLFNPLRNDAFSTYPMENPGLDEDSDFKNTIKELLNNLQSSGQGNDIGRSDYSGEIIGLLKKCLADSETSKPGKNLKFGLVFNSVKDSSTVFNPECLELMAANKVVISNYCRGQKTLLGDLALASDNARQLSILLEDYGNQDNALSRLRLMALRKVLSEHTYARRFEYILRILGIPAYRRPPHAVLIGHAKNQEDKKILVEAYKRQTWGHVHLVILQSFEDTRSEDLGILVYHDLNSLWAYLDRLDSQIFVGVLNPSCYYGPHYLEDLVLTSIYQDYPAIGKGAFYALVDNGLQLQNDNLRYQKSSNIQTDATVVRRRVLTKAFLENVLLKNVFSLPDGIESISVDEFSFIRGGASMSADETSRVDDLPIKDTGLNIEDVRDAAALKSAYKTTEPVYIKGEDFLKSLNIDSQLKRSEARLESEIAVAHRYYYVPELFSLSRLPLAKGQRLSINGRGDMKWQLVFIFYNSLKERIGQHFNSPGQEWEVNLPNHTAYIQLGLKVMSRGHYELEGLSFKPMADAPLLKSRILIICQAYPSYENIYQFAFVHARVKAYRRAGLQVEVFEFKPGVSLNYREYEGINVIQGSSSDLDRILASGQIDTAGIHYLRPPLWNVIRNYTGKLKLLIWCHGNEIQLWHRRAYEFGFIPMEQIQKRLKNSCDLEKFWPEVFESCRDLYFIFVAEYAKREIGEDFNIPDNLNYSIAPNFIDNSIFPYCQKSENDRLNLLSIRPYASRKYANDLTVQAILLLQGKPWFKDMHFTLYGDGALFDETVEPLRNLPNVEIHQSFLCSDQISAIHKKHGVYLTPTRMDWQGVSRDEAMSSGLVPVTTNICAIPEFVDENCAMLARPENALDIANAIEKLYFDPELYLRLSKAAAKRVREKSGWDQTIGKEIRLLTLPVNIEKLDSLKTCQAIVYAAVNPNIVDGSSIWLANVCAILGRSGKIAVLLGSDLKPNHVLEEFEDDSNIVLLEPKDFNLQNVLVPEKAASILKNIAAFLAKAPILVRDYKVAKILVRDGNLKNRIHTYMSGFYKAGEEVNFDIKESVQPMALELLGKSSRVHIQTPECAEAFADFYGQPFNYSILPPSVPDEAYSRQKRKRIKDNCLHIGYGGKIYPNWGIEDLVEITDQLNKDGIPVKVHITVRKIYNDPAYRKKIQELLSREHVEAVKDLSRTETIALLKKMDFSWCWRPGPFEETILEYSTKLLESAVCGIPAICYPSKTQRGLMGENYPYFAKTPDDIYKMLRKAYENKDLKDHRPEGIEKFLFGNVNINLE